MQYYLASDADQMRHRWIKRFAPAFWTIDFPRPMMAALTAVGAYGLRVDLDLLAKSDLAGLIWTSEDKWSHPLLAYETDRDYRGVVLEFDWVAGPGMMPLDAVNGATLTIEGRDRDGAAHVWYVRLWNYATGAPDNARIVLDFSRLQEGFGPGGGEVYAGDIDRLFISLTGADYGGEGALPIPAQTFVELRNISTRGWRAGLQQGDAWLPEHRLRMCSGYDDSYHIMPKRLVEQWRALGYREVVNHYLGMSHHYAVRHVGGDRYEAAGGLCASAHAWHRALARQLRDAGMDLILSVSYELLDQNTPGAWAQRDMAGNRALTGWDPPSTLLSPCNAEAMAWLQGIVAEVVSLAESEGLPVKLQVGEPWWWVGSDGAPCFYDAATVAQWTTEHGSAPAGMGSVAGERAPGERAYMTWLGEQLAQSTSALFEAARDAATGAVETFLLFFAPQVLDAGRPDLHLANMPLGWKAPAVDVLQLEDYDFVTGGNEAGMRRAVEAVGSELGYPPEKQHYFSGFVLDPATAATDWPRIADAATAGFERGVAEVFCWAWPQIGRDGFTVVRITGEEDTQGGGEDPVQAFHDVLFPLNLGFDAVGGPEFQTQVATLASGREQRNVQWAQARLVYDAGLGVRSEDDLETLVSFFRARRGQAFGFRFRDPLDWRSGKLGIGPTDQLLGIGDGQTVSFALVKRYGLPGLEEVREITHPVAGSVRVSVGGIETGGWELQGSRVVFQAAPAEGADVRAGFAFDVPVRFATDRLGISLSRWRAGEPVSVPMVEVRI